jgi:RHS repeat-associated protein
VNLTLNSGRYIDTESGLIYLRARYYDPATAQFLSRDPLTATTGAPYSYVDNNPLNETDPFGLCPWGMGELCHVVNRLDSHDGGTTSLCAGGQIFVVLGGKADACWNYQGGPSIHNFLNGRPSITVGLGMGTPSGGFGLSASHSNACSTPELAGTALFGGASIGPVGVQGAVGPTNFGPNAKTIGQGGVAIGKNWLPWPEAHAGIEQTWTINW